MRLSSDLDALRLLRGIVKTYSPSGKEGSVAAQLQDWLTAQSAFDRVAVDESGNVVAVNGAGPYLLLCSHMDTVPGRLPISFDRGEIRGRGAVDAKGSLAAMCVAASRCASAGMTNILYAAVVGEEKEGKGMKYLMSKGYHYVGGVFGEPSGGGIVVGYRGRLGLELTVKGKSAHASSAALGVNAIEGAIKVALQLKADLTTLGCAASITVIRGGRAQNVIPDRCRFSCDVRIPPSVRLDDVLKVVRQRASPDVEISTSELTPPISVGRANRLFGAAAAAVRGVGQEPKALMKVGTSDMNLFYTTTGKPCIAYGPGDASLSHTEHEGITDSDYLRSIQVYLSMIRKVLLPRE
jgi:LysW-gamma-L-lysine carboxypeptidase